MVNTPRIRSSVSRAPASARTRQSASAARAEASTLEGYTADHHFLATFGVRPALAWTVVSFAVVYFAIITFRFAPGNAWLFGLLIAGEVFHLWQLATYAHTVVGRTRPAPFTAAFTEPVDIFITVAGEPIAVVEETIRAAKAIEYPDFRVFVLNDGYVAKKDNWREIETLASLLGVTCITRRTPGGNKAGNINHALRLTRSPFVVVFDADHVPHPDFLKRTMGYFSDPKMGFVQTPQFYRNRDTNIVTAAAWEQQELFYGAICRGKDRVNAAFLCGTNMVIRRVALEDVGGIREDNIAEDIITSLFLHRRGWKSVYVPSVLAEGLAPEDMYSYTRQQFRWARGSLEIIFRHNPLFWRELSFSQRIQYLASASYYLSGLVVLMNALLPLVFLFTGAVPLAVTTMALAAVFLPYIFATVYLLLLSSNFTYTFRALAFSMSAFPVHVRAFGATLLRRENVFQVTAKEAVSNNDTRLAAPHIVYAAVVVLGTAVALAREGITASVVTNFSWALFNVAVFLPFIYAALPIAQRRALRLRSGQAARAVAPAAEPVAAAETIPVEAESVAS